MTRRRRAMWLGALALGGAAGLLAVLPTLLATGYFPWEYESRYKKSDWKPYARHTVDLLYDGVPLITQAPGGDPGGGPSFVGTRLFAPTEQRVVRFAEVDPIVRRLVAKVPTPDTLRVRTALGNGRPLYFTSTRFFLASAKPPTLILVPTRFNVPATVRSERNSRDLVNRAYNDVYDEQRRRGIDGFVHDADGWFN